MVVNITTTVVWWLCISG